MAVKEISRHFDPHHAAWIVELQNSLGVSHRITVYVGEFESCPGCGRIHEGKRVGAKTIKDIDATIAQAVKEFGAHEKKLLPHAREHARRSKGK